MSELSDQIPVLGNGFRFQWEPAQNSHVLLYPEGMKVLSESAAAIMSLVDGKQSVADIIAELERKFPGAELRQDVLEFFDDARREGWIRV